MSPFIAVVCALFVLGILGFRLLDLEQRVARLSEQLGSQELAESPVAVHKGRNDSTADVATGRDLRLDTLERRIDKLANSTASRVAEPAHGTLGKEQDILSVVERENTRIRDVQLEWQRGRWLEARESQLAQFAAQQQLSSSQAESLRRALELETDGMIAVLKKPGLANNPDQAVNDWLDVLRETDERALRILAPDQQKAWGFARVLERRMLWPWLPEQATASR